MKKFEKKQRGVGSFVTIVPDATDALMVFAISIGLTLVLQSKAPVASEVVQLTALIKAGILTR
jgi:hypothetical protein